nr:acyl-CoA dehydrogenase family protein [candidate division Zixibacteria bacterium]
MDFDIKYKDFRQEIRAYCEEKIAPHAVEVDRDQFYSREIHEDINRKGWWGSIVPKDYGGLGLSTVEYAIIVEEISRVCGSTGLTFAAHNSLGTFPIYAFGTESQRKKYLPEAAEKGKLIAFGLTEPEAGSDAGGTKSRAEKKEYGYLINGTKCWITSANVCDTAIITARTSDEGGVHGISSFIVEKGMEGFSAGKKENKMGCRGSNTAYLHLDDLKISIDYLIGKEGEGFKQFMITLDGGRISIGAMAIGLAQAALETAARYSESTLENGKPINRHQSIQFKLADMAMQVEAARLLMYKTAWLKDNKHRYTKLSAMCKLYASEVSHYCTYQAIQILGLDGITEDFPAERYFRDMKLCEIGEGTSEVQRIVIAREALHELIPKI